jgi:hypothetical protein
MDNFMTPEEVPEGGLQSLEELENYQVVRSEFISPTFRPKVTINRDRIVFNAACVRLFEETQYVLILIYREKQQLILLPCEENTKDAFKWCNIRREKRIPRSSICRMFGARLFDMMNWKPENRYKIQAIYQSLEGQRLLLFNLQESEMVVPEIITLDDGKTVHKRKRFYPDEWKEAFGMTFQEHAESYNVNVDAHYLLNNTTDGSESDFTIGDQNLQGHEPTANEIILRRYQSTQPPDPESSER